MTQLLSPKRVASSIGVSESTLKRWCDQGVIRSEKTAGGHRRMRVGDVVQYLRETNRPLVQAELLGLPAGVGRSQKCDLTKQLTQALVAGNDQLCRRALMDIYVGGAGVVEISEKWLAPAMAEVGDLWACGSAEVYNERLACEIISRSLHEIRALLPAPPADAPTAIGGSPSGDYYQLPTTLVEMTLIEAGWRATSLGSNLPFDTLKAAAGEHRPSLFWLSVSHSGEGGKLRGELEDFAEDLPAETKLVLGGRALEEHGVESVAGAEIRDGLRGLLTIAEAVTAPA